MVQLTQADGPKIRLARERKELTVDEFVAALEQQEGLKRHPDYIRNVELGHKEPSVKLIGAMARVLEVKWDDITKPETRQIVRRNTSQPGDVDA